MGDVGRLFTGRKPALDAVRVLLTSSQQRVLVFTGVSGIGKSTLLARVAARADKDWHVRLLDAQVLVGGMAVRDEGSEQAALRLLRLVGSALADGAPWWRRGWTRRRAEAIGLPRRHRVRLSIRADRGGVITHSPVTVQAGTATQAEWRAAWVQDLLRVAGLLGRRRCLLLIDTCEWLTFFDDVHAELPRPDAPLGVGGWFADVLEQILERAPELRVVLAGTAVAEA